MARPFAVLLDQYVPYSVLAWLQGLRPTWSVTHAADVGLTVAPDSAVYGWAQEHGAAVVTFGEDFWVVVSTMVLRELERFGGREAGRARTGRPLSASAAGSLSS